MLDSIQDIVDTYPMNDEHFKIAFDNMKKSYLLPTLWMMYLVYIKRQSEKKCVVWIHGEGDSGKSFLAKMLEKIFVTIKYDTDNH